MGMVARKPRASNLLFDEAPLMVIPSLAVLVGLHEAIFLQQIHYWLRGNGGKEVDGRKWIYNTRKEWQDQFPFWSVHTIKRAADSLKERGILLTSGALNKSNMDRTLWYSIDYDCLYHLAESQNDLAESLNGLTVARDEVAIPLNADSADATSNQEITQKTPSEITHESDTRASRAAASCVPSPTPPMPLSETEGFRNARVASERNRADLRRGRLKASAR